MKKHLSVIMAVLMMITMLPAGSLGGIVSAAASGLKSISLSRDSDGVLDWGCIEGIYVKAEFATASASDAWYEKAMATPSDCVKMEVNDPYKDYIELSLENSDVEQEGDTVTVSVEAIIKDGAPDGTATITARVGSETTSIDLDIVESTKGSINMTKETHTNVGRTRKIPLRVKLNNPEEEADIHIDISNPNPEIATVYAEKIGDRWNICVLGKQEGTFSFTVYILGMKATCEVNVDSRSITFGRRELIINTDNENRNYLRISRISLDDIREEQGGTVDELELLKAYLTVHEPEWTSSNPAVVEIKEIEGDIVGIEFYGKKAGLSEITVKVGDSIARCLISVKEGQIPKDPVPEIEKVMDGLYEIEDTATPQELKEAVESARDRLEVLFSDLSTLTVDAWNALEEFDAFLMYWDFIISNSAIIRGDDTLPLYLELYEYGGNLPFDQDDPKTLLIEIGEAPEADMNLLNTTKKFGFDMKFYAVNETETVKSNITKLALPVRIFFEVPDELTNSEELSVYSVHDGVLKEVPSVMDGSMIIATITELSTFIIAEKTDIEEPEKPEKPEEPEKPEIEYKIDFTAGSGGSIDPALVAGSYPEGSKIQIKAIPHDGYVFAGWSSSAGGTFTDVASAETEFVIPSNHTTITASFRLKENNSNGSVSGGYSSNNTVQKTNETIPTTPGSWGQDDKGWKLLREDGTAYTQSWVYVNNNWYWVGADGYMMTGWVQLQDKWYFLKPDGSMLAGGVTPDGYQVDGNGVWIK